jgi:hypothetical protein
MAVDVAALLMTVIMIAHIKSKYTAVGMKSAYQNHPPYH